MSKKAKLSQTCEIATYFQLFQLSEDTHTSFRQILIITIFISTLSKSKLKSTEVFKIT